MVNYLLLHYCLHTIINSSSARAKLSLQGKQKIELVGRKSNFAINPPWETSDEKDRAQKTNEEKIKLYAKKCNYSAKRFYKSKHSEYEL